MDCSLCGCKLSIKSYKIKEGKICKKCFKSIPNMLANIDNYVDNLTIEELRNLIIWSEQIESKYRKEFVKTQAYGLLKIDSLHGLVAICEDDDLEDGSFYDYNGIVFNLALIERITFDMKVIKAIENRVNVEITMSLRSEEIGEFLNLEIKRDIASINFIEGNSVRFSLPVGCQIIWDEIVRLNNEYINDLEKKSKIGYLKNDDYVLACGTFFILPSEEYTESEIKKIRNKLMKTFHPDEGENNQIYAQRITEAYNILCKKLNELK